MIQGRDLARWEYVGKGMNVDPSRQVLRVSPNGRTEILMLSDPYHITGSYLVRASQGIDEAGRNSVNFSLNSRGGQLFGALTGANLPNPATRLERHLGIVLDHELLSAPAIQSRITDNGQITGQFTQDDISFLVGILNAGSLPATLNPLPISEALRAESSASEASSRPARTSSSRIRRATSRAVPCWVCAAAVKQPATGCDSPPAPAP